MRRSHNIDEYNVVSEMTIVDTFTKLIFGIEGEYTATEQAVVQAFRTVDENVYRDSPAEMGDYLRNLGVREMIQLVSRVRQQMQDGYDLASTSANLSPGSPGRRTH
ncbi:MAG: hypothetical protein ACI9NT_000829 [Bacteroidia bacterium]|jgi:hypothetical protein